MITRNQAVFIGVFLLVLSASVFWLAYRSYDNHPDLAAPPPTGWYGSEDQHYYLVMARELSRGHLKTYHFGLGYPLLGAPFVPFLPADPFLIPNLTVTVWTAVSTFLIAWVLSARAVVGLAAALALFPLTPLIWYLVVPWNSTAVLFCTQMILLIVSSGAVRGGGSRFSSGLEAGLLGGGLAWIFAARYVDVLWLLPLAGWWLGRRPRNGKVIGVFLAVFGMGVGLILLTHRIYFGSMLRTPYAFHRVADQDWRVYRPAKIPASLWGVFVDRSRPGGAAGALLWSMPVLWFVPLGIKRFKRAAGGGAALSLGFGFLAALLFYGAHPAFSGWHRRYGAIHYLKMWFPILTVLGTLGMAETAAWLRRELVKSGRGGRGK
jgi:hypothetical protein